MADAYCGLQKSLRCGNEESSLYWAGQIAKSTSNCKGYPNALKKRHGRGDSKFRFLLKIDL